MLARLQEGIQTGSAFLINMLRARALFAVIYYLAYSVVGLAFAAAFTAGVTKLTNRLIDHYWGPRSTAA